MLRIYNTLTKEVEEFKPKEPGKVEMFTCGPSTYNPPHIGNYRTFLYEDVLQRYLEYLGYNLERVMVITDIEDKSIEEAEKEGISVEELTERNMQAFLKDIDLLRIKKPTYLPRSSTSVHQAVKLIKKLVKNGYAYWYDHEGRHNVYFDPLKFEDFGKISHLDMSKWPDEKKRFHKDTYPGTPWNKGDFVLWHGYKEGDKIYWDTEIGKGRPSWNIQDAAMITKHLGFNVDLACGGVDNLVRHHDYTVAILEGLSGTEFSHYWLHGEHLFVDGEKMSKRKGNVYYPTDLVKKGYKGDEIRFFLISEHYRKKLDFTLEKMDKKIQKLNKLKDMVQKLRETEATSPTDSSKKIAEEIPTAFEKGMNDDLDVKSAFEGVMSMVSKLDDLREKGELTTETAETALRNLRKIDRVFQVIF